MHLWGLPFLLKTFCSAIQLMFGGPACPLKIAGDFSNVEVFMTATLST